MKIRFVSTQWWHAPGMVENYRHARKVNDSEAIELFESAFPDLQADVFDALSRGEYRVEGDVVFVGGPHV